MALLIVQPNRVTGNRDREKERGSDTQQRDSGQASNPGLLQRLGTWDARSTNCAPIFTSLNVVSDFLQFYTGAITSYMYMLKNVLLDGCFLIHVVVIPADVSADEWTRLCSFGPKLNLSVFAILTLGCSLWPCMEVVLVFYICMYVYV